ncbi:acyl carrier protein [Streptomyces tubercidicus]|uniref:acyl carrier protein n=1 Tax=Streptomyces tubercidicus TaxID=47759 RepID=UPI0034674EDD
MTETAPLTQERIVRWFADFLAEILDTSPESIDPTAPLDQLGADSATVLVICARLREDLGARVRPKDVLQHFTAEGVARYLAGPLPAKG